MSQNTLCSLVSAHLSSFSWSQPLLSQCPSILFWSLNTSFLSEPLHLQFPLPSSDNIFFFSRSSHIQHTIQASEEKAFCDMQSLTYPLLVAISLLHFFLYRRSLSKVILVVYLFFGSLWEGNLCEIWDLAGSRCSINIGWIKKMSA